MSVAAPPMTPTATTRGYDICGGTNRAGNPCGRPAGWGTDHVGAGHCKLHGGSTPSGRKHALGIQAAAAAETFGLPREIDPHAALLEELHRTAGHVAWLGELLREGGTEDLKQYATGENGATWERPAIWVELYHRERKHFADVAKTCISVGIEERRVRVAEQTGQLFAGVIVRILDSLGVDRTPAVAEVVRRELTAVAGS